MKSIIKSLSAVQKDLASAGIAKGQENSFDKYKFRGIDDVLNALAPILARHEVLIVPSTTSSEIRIIQTGNGKAMNHCKVNVDYTLYDASGESITHSFVGEAMDRGDKSVNKACTAAFKYFLFEAFCIPVQGTPDADSESHEVATPLIDEADTEAFKQVLAKADPSEYMEFISGYEEAQRVELFNSAPKGQITAWKNATRKLESEFGKAVTATVNAIREHLEAGDYSGIKECAAECSSFEKAAAFARLNDIEKAQIEQMKEAA